MDLRYSRFRKSIVARDWIPHKLRECHTILDTGLYIFRLYKPDFQGIPRWLCIPVDNLEDVRCSLVDTSKQVCFQLLYILNAAHKGTVRKDWRERVVVILVL